MPVGHENYRVNESRSVSVAGLINQELIDSLTPQILHLRASSPSPITVFIDSPGGATRLGAVLANLLRCPDQSRLAPKLITVVTGYAGSAAADLLASGDYAVAYPESSIHYHGTRQFFEQGITVEAAQSLADELQQANDLFAMRLAQRSVERFMFLFLCERNNFEAYRERFRMSRSESDVKVFAGVLRTKISGRLRLLPELAIRDFEEANALSAHVFKHVKFKDQEWGKVEVDMFRSILGYELRKNKGRRWFLTEGGLAKALNDFVMFNDFTFGAQRKFLKQFAEQRWRMFVNEKEREEIESRFKGKPEEILDHVVPLMEPLWYFVYALCKRLQQSENRLSATDAYWLGIVDEVLGTGLPCVREVVEDAPKLEQQLLPNQPTDGDTKT